MSLRITPAATAPSNTTPTLGAPSAPGVHDTLRANLGLVASAPGSTSSNAPAPLQSAHPLEARLSNWRATQDAHKMEMLKRQFGVGEPVRRGMELRIARAGEWRPAVLGGAAGVHGEILAGRDLECGWEDVFKGDELREKPDFHTEMEAQMGMQW